MIPLRLAQTWYALHHPVDTQGRPNNVRQAADGYFYRDVEYKGQLASFRVCEDCWKIIPHYVDFSGGLVSPESDGDRNGNGAKTRVVPAPAETVTPKTAVEHLRKAVCLSCYCAAFQRVYPSATLPDLNPAYIQEVRPAEILSLDDYEVAPDPLSKRTSVKPMTGHDERRN